MAYCHMPPKSALDYQVIEATGSPAPTISVIDPGGHVVPAEGVQIVGVEVKGALHIERNDVSYDDTPKFGRIAHGRAMHDAVSASMLINMGYERMAEVRRPQRNVVEPVIKGTKRKPKRLHRGLR